VKYELLVLVAFVVAAVLLYELLRPKRYLVSELSEPLTKALSMVLHKGRGFVVVDAGQNFIQFCLRRDGMLIIDIPSNQFERVPRQELEELGFSLTSACENVFYVFQREAPDVEEARRVATDVLIKIFKWPSTYYVTLKTDYSHPEPPPDGQRQRSSD
jgi:hypothetical protein